jgi:hypothetical protein
VLRVVTTFSPAAATTAGLSHSGQQGSPISIASSPLLPSPAPSLSDSAVNEIYFSYATSMFALVDSGAPEALWNVQSPVTTPSGHQAITFTPQQVRKRIMGSGISIPADTTSSASPSDSVMSMDIDQENPAAGYVFGMGGMGDSPSVSICNNNYQFGLSTPSEPASSPMAEHIEFAKTTTDAEFEDFDMDCEYEQEFAFNSNLSPYAFGQITDERASMLARTEQAMDTNIDWVQAYVFGQGGMGLDFATLSDQMVQEMADQNGDYTVHMAIDINSPPAVQHQGVSTQPQPTSISQPSAVSQNQVSTSMPPPPPPSTSSSHGYPHPALRTAS